MRSRSSKSNQQHGSILTEAAMILPLFLLLGFAILKFSLVLTQNGLFTDASKLAARLGAGEPSELCEYACARTRSTLQGYFDQYHLTYEDLKIDIADDFSVLSAGEAFGKKGMRIRFKGWLGGMFDANYQMIFPLESECYGQCGEES